MPVKPPKKIKMSKAQLNALKERIRQRKLEDSDWEAVEAMVDTVDCLSQVIEEKKLLCSAKIVACFCYVIFCKRC